MIGTDEPVDGVSVGSAATEPTDDWSLLQAVTEGLNAAPAREETLQAFLLPAPRRDQAEVVLCTVDPDTDGRPTWMSVAFVRPADGRPPRGQVGSRYFLPDMPFARLSLEHPGVPVLVESIDRDPRVDAVARSVCGALGIRALLVIALTLRGSVVGLFMVQWSCEVTLGERERRIYQILSRNAALLLENMVMVDRLRASLAETQQQQRLLATVHENVPIGILCLDARTQRSLIVNRAARALFLGDRPGDSDADEIVASVRPLYPGTDLPIPEPELPGLRAVATGEIQGVEFDVVVPGGVRRSVEATCVPVRSGAGEVERLVVVLSDVTSRKHAEAERERLQAEVIAAQAKALAERSSPLIPITDDIVVMPLIGTIDPERGQQILEAALHGTRVAARVTILDVTGVPHLDTRAAEMLIQTARALRLRGIQAVLSGVRPEVAQALVALDIPLTELVTCSTLQAGVEYALRRLGKLLA